MKTGTRTPEQTARRLTEGYSYGTDALYSLLWDIIDDLIGETSYVLTDVGIPDHVVAAACARMRAYGAQHYNPET